MKDAYYFPHDCNARHDPKLITLGMKWKSKAYSCYFITIEMLREQNDYTLQAMLKPCLKLAWSTYEAMDDDTFNGILKDMINLQLLTEEDGKIYSDSLMSRMEVYDIRRDALREAGRKGGLSSAQAKLKQGSSSKVKKSKVKKSKLSIDQNSLSVQQARSFEVTWGIYPRKLGKPQAFSKYCKTVLNAEQAKQCKRAVENYLEEIEDKGTEEKFIKHGSTFFGMWQDYYSLKPFESDQETQMAFNQEQL